VSITRRTLAASVGALALLAGAATASAQDGTQRKPVVFNVGDTQNIDSMNPIVGVSVPSYEAWNIQYATLTDKSPKDFSPIPGLAESWKGSADGKTWTYTMRANQKWSDGQPLTAEDVAYTINRAKKEEWLNYTSVVANLTAKALRNAHRFDRMRQRQGEGDAQRRREHEQAALLEFMRRLLAGYPRRGTPEEELDLGMTGSDEIERLVGVAQAVLSQEVASR